MNNQQILKLIGWSIALCLAAAIIHNVFLSRHQESFRSGYESGYTTTKDSNSVTWLKYPVDYVRLLNSKNASNRIDYATDSITYDTGNKIKIVPEDSLYSIWSSKDVRMNTGLERGLLIVEIVIYLIIFITFINLIKTFSKGEVLHLKTYKNSLLLSFCILLMPIFDYTYDYVVYMQMQKLFSETEYEVVDTLKFDFFSFILGLVFTAFVIAIKTGLAIKEENELTI